MKKSSCIFEDELFKNSKKCLKTGEENDEEYYYLEVKDWYVFLPKKDSKKGANYNFDIKEVKMVDISSKKKVFLKGVAKYDNGEEFTFQSKVF